MVNFRGNVRPLPKMVREGPAPSAHFLLARAPRALRYQQMSEQSVVLIIVVVAE